MPGWRGEERPRVRPHRPVVLAAELGLVRDDAVRGAAGDRALGHLLGRLDVDGVDVCLWKVNQPRGDRRRGVLANPNLEDGGDDVADRTKDLVVRRRVVVLALPEGALVGTVLVVQL